MQGDRRPSLRHQRGEAVSPRRDFCLRCEHIPTLTSVCMPNGNVDTLCGGDIPETRQMLEARVGSQGGSRPMRAPREREVPAVRSSRPLLGDLVARGSFRGRPHVLYFGIKTRPQGRGIAALPAPSLSPGRPWSSGTWARGSGWECGRDLDAEARLLQAAVCPLPQACDPLPTHHPVALASGLLLG